MEDSIITLYLDDDVEVDCEIVTIFEAEGRDYIALLPKNADGDKGDVYLYRYSENENEEPVIENIDNDEEYEVVDEAFDEWLDAQEFDELVNEEDL